MKIQDLKKQLAGDKAGYLIFFVLLVFFLVRALCLLLTTDDVWWITFDSLSDMMKTYNPNGRLFTNAITYYICNHYVAMVIVYVLTMGLFLVSMSRLFELDLGKGKWTAILFAALVILLSPRYFSTHVYNWISGFTNYIMSAIFILWYIRFCSPVFEKKEITASKSAPLLWLLLGILGSLCVENITIYNFLFGAFIIILSLRSFKKVSLSNITFLLGTIIGCVIMFFNQRYSEIYSGSDSVGVRSLDNDFTDWMMKIYLNFTYLFARPYFLFHIIITAAIIVLYLKRLKSGGAKLKYAKLFISVIIIFTAYSIFTMTGEELVSLTLAYRVRAIEAALTALYMIALCYMAAGILDGGKRLRAIIYLVSTVVVTAPFIVVNPVTSRCFFAGYIFWALFTFELAAQLIRDRDFFDTAIVKKSATVFVGSFLFILAYMDVINKYVDTVRTGYIREQLASDEKYIRIIKLPYKHACFDPIDLLEDESIVYHKEGEDCSSPELYCRAYDVDTALLDKKWVYITMMDYGNEE